MELLEILAAAVKQNASDVVLKDGMPPMFRIHGILAACAGAPPLTGEMLQRAATLILRDDAARMRFLAERHADLAFDEPGLGRFRVNVYRQRGKVGIACRVILPRIRGIAELNLPPIVEQLACERRGLILVTGATGCGKSTTLAAMIGHINQTGAHHIITIEDPIEYLHHEKRSIISQREIGEDVNDFPSALRTALRQNPDVIMVGEMRDLETIETAIMAAETGHLVLSTLHTDDAPQTIMRTVTVFPEHKREQICLVLANVLRGVVSQRLLPTADGSGVVPAVEVMLGTLRVRECIAKQRVQDLPDLIAQGDSYGMQSFDQALLALVKEGRITQAEALANCHDPLDFAHRTSGILSRGDLLSDFHASSAACV
ncbi:MAG TPA: PilT/PilU family type 4a pilus ATPase [Candidatus Margulisiibacteriota bacterium]|nr:PilT/PilU family type 4a pilus ATPase [Candidatus Margulisiibacteriota bacterium]